MPTTSSIPVMVEYYLILIERLSSVASNSDSNSNEAQLIKKEIEYYLSLIRDEMSAQAKEIHSYDQE